ncbi:DNA repair ATPase [Streptomyces lonarensis]|uniref:DNA repair ATPase n=1 Tax=Streptomyces lonarensis TaxID=700599 RepID=A0A7X6CXZ1_9ACTN|nr:DNA repair ATPase [Streptomyces lonarensis]NJQ04637.1 DNA repair ATPase [Streptomyces lonarensis]
MTQEMDAGTYEVLRDRMKSAAADLAGRARSLNDDRVETFGGSELALRTTDRIRTEHNCVPRDIVQVRGHLLAGYTVRFGLKQSTAVSDVFGLHRYQPDAEGAHFTAAPESAVPGLLDDPGFVRDFESLFRYYRQAQLLQLRTVGQLLLAVFQTGDRVSDIRVLRWQLAADGTPTYLDAKGERDHVFPPSHDFEWTLTGREHHTSGQHPTVAIDGELFVDAVGGHLTVRVEDSTDTGEAIHSEPVEAPLQSLADAEISYARRGPLILLKVLPYGESDHRYLVHNTRTKEVVRLDGIGQACHTLPEDQGLIFPGGYYISGAPTGAAARTFDTDTTDLEYKSAVRSPNGEDVLYVFHARAEGRTLLLPYNLIRKEVANPIASHGYTLFEDGTMVVFRAAGEEATRVHPMQVWHTPFVSDAHAAAQPQGDGPLARIGNAELVRGVSDALTVARMADELAPGTAVFEAVVAACTRLAEQYHWLGVDGLHGLDQPLATLRTAAEQVIDEYERVLELRRQAREATTTNDAEVTALIRRSRGEAPKSAPQWVALLTELRRAQGRTESLRDMRHVDLDALTATAEQLSDALAATGRRAVAFLSRADAFDDAHAAVAELADRAAAAETVADADPVAEEIAEQADSLRTVTDVIGGLEISDATVRTGLLERIGEVMGAVNRAHAVLDRRRRELLETEGRAEFAAEYALLGQAVSGALAAATTPEECDEQLGRLLLQLENLESRFGAFDDYLAQLTEQREEIYETFSARKQAQLDERARHAERLTESANRILSTVERRTASLGSLDEINAYFATDPLVERVRGAAAELRSTGETVRAEELEGRVKALRQEAGRALRDRADLYGADGSVRLGRHRFGVNTQPIDLTLVPQDGALAFAVTGTDYRARVTDPAFAATAEFWDQPLASESPEVYRAEHLAATVLAETDPARLATAAADDQLIALVREFAGAAYDEGYDRGVHDHDAAAILATLLRLRDGAGLLRYTPEARAAAQLTWAFGTDTERATAYRTRARSLARARAAFGTTAAVTDLANELARHITDFLTEAGLPAALTPGTTAAAGDYLFEELALGGEEFIAGSLARELLGDFRSTLGRDGSEELAADAAALGNDLTARHQLVAAWLAAYAESAGRPVDDLAEAVALQLCDGTLAHRHNDAPLHTATTGLLGTHPRVLGGELTLRVDEFLARTTAFRTVRVPAHRAYTRQRNALLEAERGRLRLEAYRPQVMSTFVRNRLIDEVYLPLIGDNLAKQLGTTGEDRRTDSQGLLLLLSPPGYGKTTLMEYVAARLGLVLVKVDGPALGYGTTSLDPAAAPDAAARREVEKINFGLEMGNNVFLYLDDIQHCSPELLQRFIPLCDAQRRIDGVRADGTATTFDLRGKRFAICMAGNPFTGGGTRFRVPDMLANRADVWNLGDVLSGREEQFALSHIENALTSNPVLAPLAARERGDVDLLVRMARGDDSVSADRLSHPYSAADLEQITSVLAKLLHIQRTTLKVNAAYIHSATQDDAHRTEPPFLLQGSYRNTNRLAERVVPVMTEEEVESAIDDHYLAEAQTLTRGAEANLLKLAELRGRMTEEQRQRWSDIRQAFRPS